MNCYKTPFLPRQETEWKAVAERMAAGGQHGWEVPLMKFYEILSPRQYMRVSDNHITQKAYIGNSSCKRLNKVKLKK